MILAASRGLEHSPHCQLDLGEATRLGFLVIVGLAMLVITEADYSNQRNVLGGNSRTEIIVRQHQPAPPSDWFGGWQENGMPHGSCLTDDEFGLTFKTGFRATLPCRCDMSRPYLNCDG